MNSGSPGGICTLPLLCQNFLGEPPLRGGQDPLPPPLPTPLDLSNGAIFNDLERPLPPVSRSRHFDAEYLRNGTIYRHSFNGMLIGTYTRPTQQCRFEWPWVTLSDLANYSMTRSVARSLCDSWATCYTAVRRRTLCCGYFLLWLYILHTHTICVVPPNARAAAYFVDICRICCLFRIKCSLLFQYLLERPRLSVKEWLWVTFEGHFSYYRRFHFLYLKVKMSDMISEQLFLPSCSTGRTVKWARSVSDGCVSCNDLYCAETVLISRQRT